MLLMSLACDAIALGSNQVEEVSMLASSAVDRGFESRSGQTKDSAIGKNMIFWHKIFHMKYPNNLY
jgi:hypothetical protein